MRMSEPGLFERKFWNPILNLLKQGVSPEQLTRSVAFGATLALFPVFGLTTTLCFFAGLLLRLNPIAIQTVNYLMTPVQLAAIPIFIKTGEKLFGLNSIPYNPVTLANEFFSAPLTFLSLYGKNALAGILIWALFAAPCILMIEHFFLPLLKRRRK